MRLGSKAHEQKEIMAKGKELSLPTLLDKKDICRNQWRCRGAAAMTMEERLLAHLWKEGQLLMAQRRVRLCGAFKVHEQKSCKRSRSRPLSAARMQRWQSLIEQAFTGPARARMHPGGRKGAMPWKLLTFSPP